MNSLEEDSLRCDPPVIEIITGWGERSDAFLYKGLLKSRKMIAPLRSGKIVYIANIVGKNEWQDGPVSPVKQHRHDSER